MENCCICNASVAIGEEKERRKRLYGPSCKTARDVLDGELSAIFDLQLKILKGLNVLFASIAIQNLIAFKI